MQWYAINIQHSVHFVVRRSLGIDRWLSLLTRRSIALK